MLYLSEMAEYDIGVVLGSQPDTTTWQFPQQIYESLDEAGRLIESDEIPLVITSGKWGINIDDLGLTQPFRESDAMAEYLIHNGIPDDKILRERESKDSISNLYYLKTQFFIPRGMIRPLFIVAEFRVPRLQFLCRKVLGHNFEVSFLPIPSEIGSTYDEANTSRVQKEFLDQMQDGDHEWLKDKFYDAPMYKYWSKKNQESSRRAA